MLRSALRFLAGLMLGAALWWYATPAYNGLLALMAQRLIHLDHRFSHATLAGTGRGIRLRGNSIPSAQLPVDQYTFNILLLSGLFAMRRDLFRDRGIRGLALSLLLLVASHTFAVMVAAEETSVRSPGWGDLHYSGLEQDLWEGIHCVYVLAGMFAIPFICFWMTSPDPPDAAESNPVQTKKRKRR